MVYFWGSQREVRIWWRESQLCCFVFREVAIYIARTTTTTQIVTKYPNRHLIENMNFLLRSSFFATANYINQSLIFFFARIHEMLIINLIISFFRWIESIHRHFGSIEQPSIWIIRLHINYVFADQMAEGCRERWDDEFRCFYFHYNRQIDNVEQGKTTTKSTLFE